MAWVDFTKWKLKQFNGNGVNFDTTGDTLKIALLTSAYTPNRANDEFWAGISANEVAAGSTYAAGGVTLTSKTLTINSTKILFDCADITISKDATGFTNARWAVLYKDTGTPATSPVIAYYDLGSDRSIQSGDLVLETPNGIFDV